MQFQVWRRDPEHGPLGSSFLNAIFAKSQLTCFQDRQDLLGGKCLADRNELYVIQGTPGLYGSLRDAGVDVLQARMGNIIHIQLMAKLAGHFKDW